MSADSAAHAPLRQAKHPGLGRRDLSVAQVRRLVNRMAAIYEETERLELEICEIRIALGLRAWDLTEPAGS